LQFDLVFCEVLWALDLDVQGAVQALGVDLKDGGSVLEAVVKAVSVGGGQAGVDGV